MVATLFVSCKECGKLDNHEIVDVFLKNEDDRQVRVFICKCSNCGKEFEGFKETS